MQFQTQHSQRSACSAVPSAKSAGLFNKSGKSSEDGCRAGSIKCIITHQIGWFEIVLSLIIFLINLRNLRIKQTSKQFRIGRRLLVFRLNHANSVHRVLQHRGLDVAQGGDLARGAVGGFLNHVTDVTLRPVPFNRVPS